MKISIISCLTLIVGLSLVSRTDAQTALNPAGDTASGSIAPGDMVTFQVTVPDSYPGMRLVVATTGSGYADLYIQSGTTVSTSNYLKALDRQTGNNTLILTDSDITVPVTGSDPQTYTTAGTYTIGINRTADQSGALNYTLYYEKDWATDLLWDSGDGVNTVDRVLPAQVAQDVYFRVTVPADGADLGALDALVTASDDGSILLYAGAGFVPTATSYTPGSATPVTNGLVLADNQFSPTQVVTFLVHYTPGMASSTPSLTIRAGDPIVQDIGAVSSTAGANTGDFTIGPEGVAFFRAAVPASTSAWALWVRTPVAGSSPETYENASNAVMVRQLKVPVSIATSSYDLAAYGQTLVVPTYLNANGDTYFVSVAGTPGQVLNLASYQQPITPMPFQTSSFAVNLPANSFFYQTYQVTVPVQQIAWELDSTSATGNLQIAVRRANVPSPANNDAFDEPPAGVPASLTLVPPTLSDGVWYVTVYATAAASAVIQSGAPVVTGIPFIGSITNDMPTKSGWRFYRVSDLDSQLGNLGWDLLLSAPLNNRLIAIRRNAVPGQWNYRTNGASFSSDYSTFGYIDYQSAIGELQQPGHQADIWYIGVFLPDAPLGAFSLTTRLLTGVPTLFDAATPPASNVVTNQPAGLWQYFQVTVPAGALGWDVRLTNVTSGSPQLVVARDQLPQNLETSPSYYGPWYYYLSSQQWLSGYQWAAGADLTGYAYDADGSNATGRVLHMGMGQPLEPGTYYVGVSNSDPNSSAMSYTLESRGIGAGYAIPVTPLACAGGSDTESNLAPRELAYYKVTVPAGQTSWQVKLGATTGDVALAVNQGTLPNVGAWENYRYSCENNAGGVAIQKLGDEHYLLLPTYGTDSNNQPVTTLAAGDYYLAVISDGGNNVGATPVNQNGPQIGTGNAGYTLLSRGNAQTAALGNVVAGSADLTQADTLEGGEIKFYSFTVPAGLASVQVSLENITGNPWIHLPSAPEQVGRSAPDYWDYYGFDMIGAGASGLDSQGFVTLANPAPGTYTVSVRAGAGSGYPDASYSVRVHGQAPAPVAFDGGTSAVTGQVVGTWDYFEITVPDDASGNLLGWDLRLTNVTSGSPQIVVARDQLPQNLETSPSYYGPWYYYLSSQQWLSGYQWAAGADLTGYAYDADGSNATGRVLHMGMGQPLEPGTYYVGVSNSDPNSSAMSYTLESRGIGAGYAIPVTPLAYAGGSDTQSNLAPRELAYYKVTVPAGQTSWQVKLGATTGDVALAVNQGTLPNVGAWENYRYSCENNAGGVAIQKLGDEHYLLLPTYGTDSNNQPVTTLAAGDYYLAVISDGGNNVGATPVNQNGPQIGTGNAGYTLLSRGNAQTAALGNVVAGSADLTQADTLEGGEIKFYSFTVPAGLASVQVSLENITGNPWIHLPSAPEQVGRSAPDYWDYYGFDMIGAGASGLDSQGFVTLANPAPGLYTVSVRAGASSGYPDASYSVRVHGQAPAPVPFDGGTSAVTGQVVGTWDYFEITVPDDASGNLLGWDLRLTNVTSGSPQIVVARDQLPQNLETSPSYYGPWYYYLSSQQWLSGYQWAAGADLTGYAYDADGSNATGRVLHMGMGQPLEPGTYYVGVSNSDPNSSAMSYTLESRGIGAGYAIPVTPLAYAGGSDTQSNLAPRELAYYKVTVPAGQTSWQVKLSATTGDVALAVNQGTLPNVGAWGNYRYSCENNAGGVAIQKLGDEHYLLLPTYGTDSNNQPVTTLAAGDYYLAVISDGGNNVGATPVNQNGPQIGTGNAGYTLLSRGNAQTAALGNVVAGSADLTQADTLEGGEIKFYSFTVPAGIASVQVSLENITGNPWIHLPSAPGQVGRSAPYYWDYYGFDMTGAGASGLDSQGFVTLANPAPGLYTVSVRASPNSNGSLVYPGASYTVRVHALPPVVLNFSASQNAGNGRTNTDTRSVGAGQTIYYQVQLPTSLDGQPVLGWRVGVALGSGTVNWSVANVFPPPAPTYPNMVVSASGAKIVNITPPLLAAGTWYIQVTGQGSATYTLTSEPIMLYRPAWSMPAQGQPVTTTGLDSTGAVFADTGINPDGSAVLDPLTGTVTDQGIDLANGDYHYYAFTMPPGNAGIIRAQLIAINGNPDLYLQYGQVPSQDYVQGQALRALTATTNTQYGVWPVADSRITGEHPAGTWYVVVTAGGSSNARYRLRLSSGNDFAGGVVQDLALNGGSLGGQSLAAGDWRYYRVQVPADSAPASWQVTFGATLGNVDLYIRDTAPPGTAPVSYSWNNNILDWSTDNKDQGPYNSYTSEGTYTLTTPPLRPGSTYYLGFHAISDATFSVSSANSGDTLGFTDLAFYGGTLDNISIPANGALTYRVQVPADATRWKHTSVHPSGVQFYLEEGTPVDLTLLANFTPHWSSYAGATNTSLDVAMSADASDWPWIAGHTYYLTARNTTTAPLTFSLTMGGVNAQTEDENNDGIPDAWERQYFGTVYVDLNADPDADGSTNTQEFENGTDPTNASSAKYQLSVAGVSATVGVAPLGATPNNLLALTASGVETTVSPKLMVYDPGTNVTITATPADGLTFLGWAPTAYDTTSGYAAADPSANPLAVTMNSNQSFTAYAGLPLADALDTTGLTWTTGGATLWYGQTATTLDSVDAAEATGLTAYGQEAWVETTVNAPGTISWAWNLQIASGGYSYLLFDVDGSAVDGLYNTTDWTQGTYPVSGTGPTTVRWRLIRYSSADGASGDAAYLDTVSYTPWPAPVVQPASNITYTAFTANWSAVDGASGYYLDVATTSDFSGGFVFNNDYVGNVLSCDLSGLQVGTAYYYRVRAVGAPGASPSSVVVTVNTTPFPPPVAQAASLVGQIGFTANWSAVDVATSYRLDVSTTPDFSSDLVVSDTWSNATSYAVTGLQPDTTYYYQVRAVGPATSGNSNVISVTTEAFGPPVAQHALNVTVGGFTANWAALANATSYTLDVSMVADFSSGVSTYSSIGVTSFDVTGCLPGTDYYYRVRASGAPGNSDNSNVITVTTAVVGAPTIATQPQPGFITSGQTVTLTINAGGSGLNYQWYRGVSGDTSNPVVGATSASFTPPTLTATTSYWVQVTNTLGSIDSATTTLTYTQPSLTLAAWGNDGSRQASVGSGTTGLVAVAGGEIHTLALKRDGTILAWGDDTYGQTSVPAGLTGVTAIAGGAYHSLALKSDGTVVAWGYNFQGQATVPAGLTGVVAIAAGAYHSLALKSDGTVVAWGEDYQGQTDVPAGLTGVTAIAGGAYHSLALKSDGTVVAWGYGQTDVPAGLTGVTAIAAGWFHSLALKSDGTVVAWGNDSYGQTDVPSGLSGVVAIAAGVYDSLALKSDGTVVAWGDNSYGQTTVPTGLSGVVAIAAGGSHSLALFEGIGPVLKLTGSGASSYDLTVSASGAWTVNNTLDWVSVTLSTGTGDGMVTVSLQANNSAQPRFGTFSVAGRTATVYQAGAAANNGTLAAWGNDGSLQTSVPSGLSGVVAIAAGIYDSLALKSDGTVVAWGNNEYGQTDVPAGLTGVTAIAGGSFYSLALKSDGTVVAWGYDGYGQTDVPSGLTGVVAIAAGADHSLALKSDGTVVAWGYDGYGQTDVPSGLTGVVAIAGGAYLSLALKSDGTVVAWGYNFQGLATVPAGLTGVVAIAAGTYHSLALKSDGTVVAWGYDSYGQTDVPAALTGVTAIAGGFYHSLALKSDGTVVAWGDNSYGQTTVPASLSGVVAIAAGGYNSFALMNEPIVAPTIGTQPTGETVTSGGNTSFTVTVTGNPAPTFQWQMSTDAGSTWTSLTDTALYSGTATAMLTITGATAAMNGYQYECLASNSVQGNVPSNAVTLTVNAASGAATLYVSPDGNQIAPYNSLANATRNIQTAVDLAAAGDEVVVAAGTYTLTTPIQIAKGITVRSAGGAAVTTVDGNNATRCFYLNDANALVDGFTITKGQAQGGGVYVEASGTVRNCIVTNNQFVQTTYVANGAGGAGVFLHGGGTIENSVITGNTISTPYYMGAYGGGIYCDGGGLVQNCRIENNYGSNGGGGVYVNNAGTVRTCLIVNNQATNDYGGGVALWKGGVVENCTVSGNQAFRGGGLMAISDSNGTTPVIRNTIIYGNSASSEFADANVSSSYGGGTYTNNCASVNSSSAPLPGAGNITSDPLFVNASAGNYRLQAGSPCIDTGGNLSWTGTAVDLDGQPRVSNGTIDMGAYESVAASAPPAFTTQPMNQTVTAGGATTFTVAAAGDPAPSDQWQASIDGGSTWSNLTETAMYSGTATGTLTIAAATTAMNGFQYRCVASNGVDPAATSNVVTLTVSRSMAAQADFNGDGQTDLVWQNLKTGERKVGLMNGTTTSSEVSLGVFDVAWQIVGTGDFNGDGQTDTLWQNTSTGEYAVYLMNGTTPINWVSLGTTSKDWQIAGVGDFNGDGQPDILWQNTSTGERGLYLMNGTTPTTWISLGTFSTAWQIVGTGDFNGDGQTDTLWQNTGTGEYAVYLMNGATLTNWISLGTVPTAWQIAGVGDFNGDGKPDILWQNTSTGGRGVYLMNGTAVISWVSLETVSTDWSLMANRAKAHAKSTPDDFNGDGQSDLLWQNTATGERGAYLMNGTTPTTWVSLGTFSTSWQIVGTGDFNGDGKLDSLWQNAATGEYALYCMNGTAFTDWISLGTVSTAWQIVGVADFNGDGQPDILWQNTSTGERGLYLMNGTVPTTWISLGVFSTAWQIVGVGDFNGDGQMDTLWQNTGTGEYAVYLMNGTTFTDWISLGTVPTAWQIAGVGDFNGDGQPDILWQNTVTGDRGVYLMNGTTVSSWVSLGNFTLDWLMKN